MNHSGFNECYPKLKKILSAAIKSKYYEALFASVGFDSSKDFDYAEFSKIPITDKLSYSKHFQEMPTADIDLNSYKALRKYQEKREFLINNNISLRITSGSTGEPLEILRLNSEVTSDYLMFNRNRKRLTDYDFSGQFVWLWPVNPAIKKAFNLDDNTQFSRVNAHGFMYYMYYYNETTLKELYNFIITEKCEWITAPPSALAKLANFILNNGLSPVLFKYIECHSEVLFDWQKEQIKKVFGVVPVSIYSSNEVQFMGGTCDKGHMHIFNNACFVEIVETEKGSELVITSLLYDKMPIIRYRIGDKGLLQSCGDTECSLKDLPTLMLSGYRSNDFVKLQDGETLEPFVITDSIYLLFTTLNLPTSQYRVVQRELTVFEYYLAPILLDKSQIIIEVLRVYYLNLLNIEVEIVLLPFLDSAETRKFKYFECLV